MPGRDKPPAAPPRRDRRARDAETPSGSRDTPKAGDDIGGTRRSHQNPQPTEPDPVHAEVTQSASPTQDARRVGHIGDELKALRLRAGLSAAELAAAMDMPPTSYKTHENRPSARRPYLPMDLVNRLAPHLLGRGRPPITQQDLLWLAGVGTTLDAVPTGLATLTGMSHSPRPYSNARLEGNAPVAVASTRDVPVVASRPITWGIMAVNLAAAPVDFVPRPAALATNRSVWALTLADASMTPRFDPGERLYCDPTRPPPIGGYVVLLLQQRDDDPPGEQRAMVGRLTATSARDVEIETLSPPNRHSVPTEQIHTIARVLTLAELLGG